jgi:peptidyl-prolyl cis-trans isomerase D
MLAQFRTFAKSPVATVLIGLLLVSFAVWGSQDVFKAGLGKDVVVQAGKRTVSSEQFKTIFDRYRKSLEEQNQGQPVTTAAAIAEGLDGRILDEVASDEAFAAWIAKSGVRPSDQLVGDFLGKQPRFRDPVSGRFDKTAFNAFLREQNITEAQVVGDLKDSAAQQHYVTGLAAGLSAPLAYTALQAAFLQERRAFDYLVIPASAVGAPIKPTDADIQKFIDDNATRLTRPETRTVTLVRFSALQATPGVTADPAAVQKRYEFEKDSLSIPEKRTVVQIPLKSAAQAADVTARLKSGENPASVAKLIGAEAVTYADVPKTGVPDRKLSDAAFSMAAGEVKGPVQGDLGLAVLKVVSVAPGKVPTLDEVRPKIEAEVKKQAALDKVSAMVDKYEDLRNGGQNMLAAAKAVGAMVVDLPAFTANGLMMDGERLPAPQKLITTAFGMGVNADSDTELAAPGEYYAIHLAKITPPTKLTVDEVRAPVTAQLMQQDMMKRLTAKADELAARLKKGETVAAVAASAGASVGRGVDVQRDAAGKSYSEEFLGRVFNGKVGEVVAGRDVRLGYVVGKITGVSVPPPQEMAIATGMSRQGARQALIEDMMNRARAAARELIKPKIDAKRARAALGADGAGAQ